jgi:hypothetical protein
MKRLTLHRIASSLYHFIAFVAQLWLEEMKSTCAGQVLQTGIGTQLPTQRGCFLACYTNIFSSFYISPGEETPVGIKLFSLKALSQQLLQLRSHFCKPNLYICPKTKSPLFPLFPSELLFSFCHTLIFIGGRPTR